MIRLLTWIRRLIVGHAVLFWPAMIANLLGAVIGTAWWYGPQLLASPLWAYPFIPDCPLAAGVATVAFFGLRYGKRWPFFNALVAFGCMKYGVWTMAFWLKHWTGGGEVEPISLGLFITHIGLFCEGALLATVALPLSLPKRLTVFLWYVLSIVVDYGLGFHPPLTEFVPVAYAFWVAAAMTFILGLGLLLLPRLQPATAPATVPA